MTGKPIEIVPTCVPSSAADLTEKARTIMAFAPAIHIDITDGLFAPALTWPYTSKGIFGDLDLLGVAGLASEMHLMVEEPYALGVASARAGARRILGHVEAFKSSESARSALKEWRANGAEEVGVGVLLATPLDVLEPLISACDVVHFMSIASIGTQGIPYEAEAPARIREFHEEFPEMPISVDGGVGESNIADLVRAGARRFGIGSAIAKAPDPAAAYAKLKALAEDAAL